jgi:NADH:ubiquinone oxidoreductase subunit C
VTAYDRLPDAAPEVFGEEATAEHAFGLLTVDVPAGSWTASLEIARDELACTYFDWLSAVDEPGTGFRICAHVVSLEGGAVRRLLLRTTVPHTEPVLPSAVKIYAGASWHERETHEMFGVVFTDHPNLVPLLLPETFEGHPLRKDFVLAARVAKAWPGAKEPGESHDGGPKRRQMLPPGVPDPNEWGPQKGKLPAAPARPARAVRTAGAAAGATPDRPARRTRSVTEGSASQTPGGAAAPTEAPAAPVRRSRSASDGSVSQSPAAPAPDAPRPAGNPEAPWHSARPAFEGSEAETPASEPRTGPRTEPAPEPAPEPEPAPASVPEAAPAPEPAPEPDSGAAHEAAPEPSPKPVPAPDPETPAGGDTP